MFLLILIMIGIILLSTFIYSQISIDNIDNKNQTSKLDLRIKSYVQNKHGLGLLVKYVDLTNKTKAIISMLLLGLLEFLSTFKYFGDGSISFAFILVVMFLFSTIKIPEEKVSKHSTILSIIAIILIIIVIWHKYVPY